MVLKASPRRPLGVGARWGPRHPCCLARMVYGVRLRWKASPCSLGVLEDEAAAIHECHMGNHGTEHRSEIEGQVGGKSTRGHEIEHDLQVYLANLGQSREGGRSREEKGKKRRRDGTWNSRQRILNDPARLHLSTYMTRRPASPSIYDCDPVHLLRSSIPFEPASPLVAVLRGPTGPQHATHASSLRSPTTFVSPPFPLLPR